MPVRDGASRSEGLRTQGVRSRMGPGPFSTRILLESPGGGLTTWESRRSRKQPHPVAEAPARRIGTWLALLFAIGSVLFGIGVILTWAGSGAAGATYFTGSLCFTAAAYLQFVQAVSASGAGDPRSPGLQWFAVQPGRISWWVTGSQLVGTLLFNVNTFLGLSRSDGTLFGLTVMWRPDLIGSLLFLVSGILAYAEYGHGRLLGRPGDVSWWIVTINLAGCLAFLVSAVGAHVPIGGDPTLGDSLTNWGTLLGAMCFLVGSLLLFPEIRSAPDGSDRRP